jgi:hypothetical protein
MGNEAFDLALHDVLERVLVLNDMAKDSGNV